MTYLEVKWIHNFVDEPEFIYSELDQDRYEIRKVELFKNSKKGYATASTSFNGSFLSKTTIPSIDEINLDSQFHAREISSECFERIWNKAISSQL